MVAARILLTSLLLCSSLSANTVKIGVFTLFRPIELRVSPARGPILVTIGDQQKILEGHQSSLIRLREVTAPVHVTARDGTATSFHLSIPGKIERRFHGTLTIEAAEYKLVPVVTIDLEVAVASVVAAELMPSTPIEALKAQAVAARSFFAAGAPRHDVFDFCDTTHCQFLREWPVASSPAFRATRDTNGLLLQYAGLPIAALYSASCGGRTRSLEDATTGYPYRAVDCDYCRRHKPGQIQGHQLGLCQSGAAAMAASGADFRTILDHYYPGTSVGQTGPGTGTTIFLLPHSPSLRHSRY